MSRVYTDHMSAEKSVSDRRRIAQLEAALDLHGGVLALLRVEKKFEGGLVLPAGTPISVQETGGPEWIGSWRRDPYQLSLHCFSLRVDEFTLLRRRSQFDQ